MPGPKSYKKRGRFQQVHELEESAGHCSRKLWKGRKLVASADADIVPRYRWTTQTSPHGDSRCVPSLQKHLCDSASLHVGQAREIKCSSPNICKEERLREVPINSLCEK